MMTRIVVAVAGLLLGVGLALAQGRTPGSVTLWNQADLARAAALRFPQKVRVGDLLGRDVLQPVERQVLLGTVRSVVRGRDGQVEVVVDYGRNLLGFGGRPIALPIEAMVLLGQAMEIVAFTPEQLKRFPTFSPEGSVAVSADTIVRVGLAKPSH